MKSKFSMSCGEWGMLLLRVVVGVVFIAHGWQKLQMIDGIIGFFGKLGFAPFLAYVVAWTELLAGLGMLLGVFTRIAGYLIAIIMAIAMFSVKFKIGFLGGYELDLTLLVAALALAWNGPGKLSVANKICGCGKCMMCGGEMKGMMTKGNKCDNCEGCKDNCTGHEAK
jgi:uncharacterized membrane protein YphA (DoxX/SURF4 family)